MSQPDPEKDDLDEPYHRPLEELIPELTNAIYALKDSVDAASSRLNNNLERLSMALLGKAPQIPIPAPQNVASIAAEQKMDAMKRMSAEMETLIEMMKKL